MSRHSMWIAGTCLGIQLALAGAAMGAGAINTKTGAPIEGSRSSPTGVTISGSPASIEQEYAGRLDVSVGKTFGVGFEGNVKSDREEADGQSISDEESRRAQGMGGALFLSAYTGRRALTGLYGGLGFGYRKESVKWQVTPDVNDSDLDLSLVKSDQKLHHAAELSGPTAHLRAGYRFLIPESPILLGAYVGGRYFDATISDGKEEDGSASTPMTDSEKSRLVKDYSAKVEAAVELGIAF